MDVKYSVPGELVRVIYAPLNTIDRVVFPKRWEYIYVHDPDAFEEYDLSEGPSPLTKDDSSSRSEKKGKETTSGPNAAILSDK